MFFFHPSNLDVPCDFKIIRCLSKKIPGCEANAASDLANSLIAQAKDEANLATMYEGWTSWI